MEKNSADHSYGLALLELLKLLSSGSIWSRVARNFSALMVVRGVSLVTPVIALPYLIRVIGLDLYGRIAFATVIATFAGSIVNYGFAITGVKAIAVARNDHEFLSQSVWRNIWACSVIGVVVSFVHAMIILSFPALREFCALHMAAMLLAVANALFPHWLFLGLERSYLVAVSTLFIRVLYLILLFLFVRTPEDFVLAPLLGAATAWINVGIALVLAIKVFGLTPRRISLSRLVSTIRDGFPAFLLQWAPNLYNSATLMVLGIYVPSVSYGAFGAAQAVTSVLTSFGQLLANAFLPILSVSFGHHSKAARALLSVGGLVTVAMLAAAPVVAMLLADDSRDAITRDLRYLALSIPFAFGYFAYGHSYVALTEARATAGRITLIISLAGLALSFALVPPFASAGAALVILLARFCMFAMSFYLHRRDRSASAGHPI